MDKKIIQLSLNEYLVSSNNMSTARNLRKCAKMNSNKSESKKLLKRAIQLEKTYMNLMEKYKNCETMYCISL